MSAEEWNQLSEWHNKCLTADPEQRRHLRAQLAAERPELVKELDELLAASAILPGFMETPAFVLAAHELAAETPTLDFGADVGPYQIVGLLAHGGMGDVYRATDTRLRRDVALKILTYTSRGDTQRTERFLKEARITAALDHPNVVRIYDVGMFDGRPYLVEELLDGETLRARISSGPLPIGETQRIATELARGLAAAHGAGLVHRDMKPENVFLTRSGVTKILDFGIAKLAEEDAGPAVSATVTGFLLGTAAYLAPEQIRSGAVDNRADLFALGSIVFEMLTGTRAFSGDNTVDTLHAVLHEPTPDVLTLRTDAPPTLCAVVTRLLEKQPEDRFQSATDLAWTFERFDTAPVPPTTPKHSYAGRPAESTSRWLRKPAPWLAAVVVLAALAAARWLRSPLDSQTEPLRVAQFKWVLPPNTSLGSEPVVSPDGRRIVFAGVSGTTSRLFVRDLASLDASALPGTQGAKQPFWSPDGTTVAFFANGKLMKVALPDGDPVVLADAADARGGAWSSSGVIVFQPEFRDSGLASVSASGGEVHSATLLDVTGEDVSHRWPAFLPDGVHFVYYVVSLSDSRRGVYVGRIDSPATNPGSPLFRSDSSTQYVALRGRKDGVLLSVADGNVRARPFDATLLSVTGEPRTIALASVGATPHHPALLSASADVLTFASSPVPYGYQIASIGRDGQDLQVWPERELGGWPRISPGGNRLVRSRVDPVSGNPDLWVADMTRGTQLRVTTSRHNDTLPVWSPDGLRIAYRSGPEKHVNISIIAADGSGDVTVVACPRSLYCEPTDWSADGRFLLANVGPGDVWTIPIQGQGPAKPILAEPFLERDARLSPDGQWIAYVSDESGRPEVSVRSISGPPRRFLISSGGAEQPAWRRDSAELFYASLEGQLYSAMRRPDKNGNPTFEVPARLNVPTFGESHSGTVFDVSPDGRRIYFLQAGDPRGPREIGVVLDWSALLR